MRGDVIVVQGCRPIRELAERFERAPSLEHDARSIKVSSAWWREAGDRRDAITVLERNARENPDSAATYLSLSKAYAATSQRDHARQSFEKSIALDRASSEAKEKLAKHGQP